MDSISLFPLSLLFRNLPIFSNSSFFEACSCSEKKFLYWF
jgi:hypothetical protein